MLLRKLCGGIVAHLLDVKVILEHGIPFFLVKFLRSLWFSIILGKWTSSSPFHKPSDKLEGDVSKLEVDVSATRQA
jgi:hypothetical protein